MTGPEHYRQAEQLADQAHHFTYGDGADPVVGAALATEAQVHATLALAAALPVAQAAPMAARDVTVYRSAYEHEPFPLGLYSNLEAAQAHCEAVVSREHGDDVALFFDWIEDEDEREPLWELVVRIGVDEQPSGYTVAAVVAEGDYTPEVDAWVKSAGTSTPTGGR
ncbi:hypothetical protein [Streptomyces nymphaeiformis]|jgi:hypothetical protein|uniref:Uncharacterized protein n=1 Tax=Streptomyces nymphaeiformis TaxID=2663842 RepID=A0A7W7XHR4_9ACTN|nr:hypothetical protein [Streptomyces nymphaeiformis]MBB4987468.1 hypothetical protein [Streptomyces nymphaeiformis]